MKGTWPNYLPAVPTPLTPLPVLRQLSLAERRDWLTWLLGARVERNIMDGVGDDLQVRLVVTFAQ